MSQQTIKQQARRAAREMTGRRRRERVEREQRIEDLVVQIMTAIGERDAAVADAERRLGHALRELTESEGMTLGEAVEWCGEQISVREATRLRRLVDGDGLAGPESRSPAASGGVGVGAAVG